LCGDGEEWDTTSCVWFEVLEIEGLVLRRGRLLLARRIDCAVPAGAFAQVVGPNGSGKSTLLRILAGFGRPEEGAIRWRGDATEEWTVASRGRVAFLGHQEGIKSVLTPEENLAYRRLLTGPQGWRVPDPPLFFDTSALPRLPCRRLSAGQRRRVALACLEHSAAPLWLLDEPLTSLDEAGIAAVSGLLTRHLRAGGTAVVASHQPLPPTLVPAVVLKLGEKR
jgi:heme exporter protein A